MGVIIYLDKDDPRQGITSGGEKAELHGIGIDRECPVCGRSVWGLAYRWVIGNDGEHKKSYHIGCATALYKS